MSSRIANTVAKIPAASRGPRQLSTMVSLDLLSNMVEQLQLILVVRGDRHRRQRVRPIPNAIEQSQAAAQFFGNFDPRLDCRLRAASPPARELVDILAIRAIAANREYIDEFTRRW